MVKIPLYGKYGKGKFALVDDIDADLVELKWHVLKIGYAARTEGGGKKPKKHFYLHRIILERKLGRPLKPGEVSDHIDRDKLNNLRSNLRVTVQKRNTHNAGMRSNNQSGYIGVSYNNHLKKWIMQINTDDGRLVAYFDDPVPAAQAYDAAARKYRGQFVGELNFPDEHHFLEDLIIPGMFSHNTSGYRGVTFNKQCQKWQAQIKINQKNIYLGIFEDIIEAALAYDAAAHKYFGPDAYQNFPKR